MWTNVVVPGRIADQTYLQGLEEGDLPNRPGWYLGVGEDPEDPTFSSYMSAKRGIPSCPG